MSADRARWRRIKRLHRDIPSVPCIAGCVDCCGPTAWSAEEMRRVADRPEVAGMDIARLSLMPGEPAAGLTFVHADGSLPDKCPFARPGRGCAVYDDRPLVCRLFGAVADEPRLTCPHGCKAAKPMGREQHRRRIAAYFEEIEDV